MFAAKKFEQIIRGLVSDPAYKPVIILQTDEGPYPAERVDGNPVSEDWRDFSLAQLQNKFRIPERDVLARRGSPGPLPHDDSGERVPDDLQSVFGSNLPLLPDRSDAQQLEPFALIEVTDRLKE